MWVRLAIGGGLLAVGSAAIVIDRSVNYVQIPARVDKLESQCHFEKKSFRRREWTRDGPCELVELLKDEPDFREMNLIRNTKVVVRYISPADGQTHTADYQLDGDKSANASVQVNGVVQILAHKTKPVRIMKL